MRFALRAVIFCLAVALCMGFTSCFGKPTDPRAAVKALCSAEAGLPAGRLYSSDASEGSDEYLPRALLSSYGIPPDYEGIEGAAIYLSGSGHPCEFAVFLCRDGRSTDDISLFLNERIRSLSRNAVFSSEFCGISQEEYESYLSGAAVIVSGRQVALIISSDPSEARRTFLRAA